MILYSASKEKMCFNSSRFPLLYFVPENSSLKEQRFIWVDHRFIDQSQGDN